MNSIQGIPKSARFGPYDVDLRSGELTKDGKKIRLQKKSFEALTALLEHPGEIVTREELRAKLWPGDVFVDFEDNLNTAVNRLRLALHDSAEKPQFIETLRGRGYRLKVAVSQTNFEVKPTTPPSFAVRALPLRASPASTSEPICRAPHAGAALKCRWRPNRPSRCCVPKRSWGCRAQGKWQAYGLTNHSSFRKQAALPTRGRLCAFGGRNQTVNPESTFCPCSYY